MPQTIREAAADRLAEVTAGYREVNELDDHLSEAITAAEEALEGMAEADVTEISEAFSEMESAVGALSEAAGDLSAELADAWGALIEAREEIAFMGRMRNE